MYNLLAPRPVRLPLGDRVLPVHELRLYQIAELMAWASSRVGSPYVAAAEATAIQDAEQRRQALIAAYDSAEKADANTSDSPAATLASPEGMVRIIGKATRLAPSAVREILQAATTIQVEAVLAVAWGQSPLEFAQRLVDREAGVVFPAVSDMTDPRNWPRGLWSIMQATGWTPSQISRLTISQWAVVCGNGEPANSTVTPEVPVGWTWEEFVDRVLAKREAFFSDPQPGGFSEGP